MNDNTMPLGLPEDPQAFAHRIAATKDALHRKFGPAVPASSAIGESLLQSLEEIRAGKTPTGFWVRVTRRAIDLLRQQQRREHALAQAARAEAEEGCGPADVVAARELFARLTDVNGLTNAERDIWLLYCEGKADYEIAAALNKKTQTVRVALSRARKRVAERLAELRRREG